MPSSKARWLLGATFTPAIPSRPPTRFRSVWRPRLPRVGGKFLQSEDELCSIYALTGASLAGAKAMTATASAGYNYMQEGIGYAIASEIPCVIVDVQRCRGENFATQADVMQMRWGASGDHEMIVLAPSSVQELFDFTIRAFNLAERYRTPVVVMSETTIALMREKLVIPEPEEIEIVNRARPRYRPKSSCPSRAAPTACRPCPILATAIAFCTRSTPTTRRAASTGIPEVFEALYQRITGKITANYDDIVQTEELTILDDAEMGLMAYGSECRPALEAVEQARAQGIRAGLLKLDTVWPVPEREIRRAGGTVLDDPGGGDEHRQVCRRNRAGGRGTCPVVRVTKNRGLVHTPGEILEAIGG